DAMVREVNDAVIQLHAVHAAFWEPGIGSARDKALRQVVTARADGVAAERVLRLAPGLVGADGPRTYLVVVLSPAEQEGAGGAALNFTAMRFNQGAMTMIKNGATPDLAS